MPHLRALVCSFSAENAIFSSVSRSQFFSGSAIASTFHIQIDAAISLEHIQACQLRAAARPAAACAALRRIQRAMRGAYQILAVRIEKLPWLPVEFHRDVRAAVDVAIHPAAMTDSEGRRGFAIPFDLEAHAVAALGELAAGADQARARPGQSFAAFAPAFADFTQAFAELAQAFLASHGASSCGVSMQARGLNAVRLSRGCAPQLTPPARTPD